MPAMDEPQDRTAAPDEAPSAVRAEVLPDEGDTSESLRPVVFEVSRGVFRVLEVLQQLVDAGENPTRCVNWTGSIQTIATAAGYGRRHTSDLLNDAIAAGLLMKQQQGHGQLHTWYLKGASEEGRPFIVRPRGAPTGRDVVRSAGTFARRPEGSTEASQGAPAPMRQPMQRYAIEAPGPMQQPMHSGPVFEAPSISVDPSSSSPPLPHTAAAASTAAHPGGDEAGEQFDTGDPYEGDPFLQAIADRLRAIGLDPRPDSVHALAALTAEQARWFWAQTALYPPRTSSPNYTLSLAATAVRACPRVSPPDPLPTDERPATPQAGRSSPAPSPAFTVRPLQGARGTSLQEAGHVAGMAVRSLVRALVRPRSTSSTTPPRRTDS